MANRNPSDLMEVDVGLVRSNLITVGEARDFIGSPTALLRPIKLLKTAKGLSALLHNEIDYDYVDSGLYPLEEVLPEEQERLAGLGKQLVDEAYARRLRK